MSEDIVEMVIPKTLGPGDSDGINRGMPLYTSKPPGPGDDDRPVDRGVPIVSRGPLEPGETDPTDRENRNVRVLAQPAAGPGETFVARRITVFANEMKE
jgi:hypothetical protein